MRAVALCEVRGTAEAAAPGIAEVLGMGVYEPRAWLAGVLPRVVMQSADVEEAERVARSLRALGHGVITVDVEKVVPGRSMVHVHRFAFDQTGLWANDGQGEHILWDDIAAVIVITRRVDVARRVTEREPMPRALRAPPIEVRIHTYREHILENAAHLFPRDRAALPWMMSERDLQFLALGSRMRLTRHDNFREVLSLVRASAPGAVYDERYGLQPRVASQMVNVSGHESAMPELSDAAIDLQVHVLAEWLLRGSGNPYREAGR
jgi:hypothetical protein